LIDYYTFSFTALTVISCLTFLLYWTGDHGLPVNNQALLRVSVKIGYNVRCFLRLLIVSLLLHVTTLRLTTSGTSKYTAAILQFKSLFPSWLFYRRGIWFCLRGIMAYGGKEVVTVALAIP